MEINWNDVLNAIVNWATTTGVKIIIALVLMFISFKLINHIGRKIVKRAAEKNRDKTLVKTLVYIGKLVLKVVIIVCLIGYLGIDTSGLTALITALGVGLGLAVNGALSNFAGGILILITRPFKLDDFIEVGDVSGTVIDIRIITTKILTPDNKTVYLPNGVLSNSNIINYSETGTRRLDLNFSISYDEDYEKAKEILNTVITSHELILKDPAPSVRVSAHKESAINLSAKVWVKSSDYWTVNFDLLEQVKTAFDKNGIKIPYNQLDVHVKK